MSLRPPPTRPAAPHRHHRHPDAPSGPAGTVPARTAVLVTVGALVVGALLNARPLADTAAGQEPGWRRDVAVPVTDALVRVSAWLHLDHPRAWFDDALGRGDPDPAGVPDPSGARAVFVPTPERPARLLVAGDSLTDTFGPALVNRSEDSDVVDADHEIQFSSGLNRPVYDWPAHLAADLDEHPADIVVFMIGANDGVPIQTAGGWVGSDTEAWKAAYRQRVAATMDLLTARTATVYWVGTPVVRSDSLARKVAVMNEIFRTEAAHHPGVRYVDAWDLFTGPGGGYSASLPGGSDRDVLMRRPDGVHLTPAGAERLTDAVWAAIRRDWDLPGAAGPPAPTTATTTTPSDSTTTTATTALPATAPGATPLKSGARGTAVTALQQRLVDLGYWLGAVDGIFGSATSHAVVALQKTAGLARTGIVDGPTRAALDAGRRPEARSITGRAVEIDLARQILYTVADGQVEQIFDTSTGRAGLATPTGRFTVLREIDTADYHGQYRPKQFYAPRALSVHGYGSVPTTPYSHGCARVTTRAMDHLWSSGAMPVGTPVWVY